MFNELVVSGVQVRTNKPWTVAVSAALESTVLGVLILIPLVSTEILPRTMLSRVLVAPVQQSKSPAPALSRNEKAPRVINVRKMLAPGTIPKHISIFQDTEPVIYEDKPFDGSGGEGHLLTSIVDSGLVGPPMVGTQPLRKGGDVESALLINRVIPEYPVPAKIARISGTILLHAIIAKDGTVQELQCVSGPPLLVAAAINAVKQWRYKPTLLNDEPVEVDTTIEVVFHLGS